MQQDCTISVKNLSKCYQIYERPFDRVKQALFRNKPFYKEFWALQNVSFELKKGEAFGIIGRNGSGKSTLLQMLCKTLTPTTGEIEVNGRIGALLELGAGFNPEFTGRENVYINGSILGLSYKEIDERFDEIAAFANIGAHIDQPVKTYSSGMFVRLAFAIQACIEPDILIVDEALSVGDVFFQQKCHERMEELLSRNTSIIFVSHDMIAIEKYCDQVLVLDKGQTLFMGQPNEAVERYYHLHTINDPNRNESKEISNQIDAQPLKTQTINMVDPKVGLLDALVKTEVIEDWPNKSSFLSLSEAIFIGDQSIAQCTGVALCNASGKNTAVFELGETAIVYYEFKVLQDIGVPIGGVVITDKMNINIHGKTSLQCLQQAPGIVKAGTLLRFRQRIELLIAPGEYVFQVGLATINSEDYAKVTQIENELIDAKHRPILRVRQCGRISVRYKSDGLRLPFFGYVDLKGDVTLSLLPANLPL